MPIPLTQNLEIGIVQNQAGRPCQSFVVQTAGTLDYIDVHVGNTWNIWMLLVTLSLYSWNGVGHLHDSWVLLDSSTVDGHHWPWDPDWKRFIYTGLVSLSIGTNYALQLTNTGDTNAFRLQFSVAPNLYPYGGYADTEAVDFTNDKDIPFIVMGEPSYKPRGGMAAKLMGARAI
jgi:hypothetical protein